ncbi:MerR family transcriptional regulator [[Mycobacterium] wendilense]|uniref:MerR family transcriptional regulator n=1 Tax=[Mycobacterium] wendilense TaxID=3064284 RepID=A0ABN9P950_9MYCO|nr:MerR family transcriptional regulator [Mycolicibacterium sp. MU0050]CAJ1587421.1 MerR family transcriptional regulator [Mycolicibacterium sp. MU0050]
MATRLSIGEFATVTHLSVRTLRRYHDSGLLEPAWVDEFSGYRYYSVEQIATAQVIHRLRELDVPLAEIRAILATDDPQQRAEVIAGHLRRAEAELERARDSVASLRRLLRPEPADIRVELRSIPSRKVAQISARVRLEDSLRWFSSALDELDAEFPTSERLGPPGGLYDNELFSHGAGRMTVFRPVRDPRRVGRIGIADLPPAELAVVVHPGPHDGLDVTYGRLGAWIVNHALAVDGPVHETYLVGPRDTPDAAQWRTEIGWPVFRLAGTAEGALPSSGAPPTA